MKKFRLKPLGALHQKLNMNWFFIGLVMALCVSACSDDDDDNTTPAFPEKQTIDCSAGDTKELTFDANANWTLTSSATWCRFVVDGNEEYSLSGNAGKQTITLKITDEAQQFDAKSIAQITLMMGSSKAIIADIARNAKGMELKLYDMDGNEIEAIEVGYKGYQSFIIKANFRFAATNRPEWLDIQGGAIVGISNKEVVGNVQIVNEAKFFKYIQNGELTFADEKGLYSKSFKLAYNGMPRDVMDKTGNQYNWEVSLDGKIITQTSSSGSSTSTSESTYNTFVPFTVTAYDDDFVMVYAEAWGDVTKGEIDFTYEGHPYPSVVGIRTKKDKENIRISFEASAYERTAYVYAFPRELFNQIKETGFEDVLLDNSELDGLNYRYAQNYLLMMFNQKDKKVTEPGAFKVTYQDINDNWNIKELTCTKVTDPSVEGEYGTTEVYTMVLPMEAINMQGNLVNFTVNPLLEGEFSYYEYTDEAAPSSYCEGGENDTYVSIPVDDLNSDLRILFKQNWMTVKVLIITPN